MYHDMIMIEIESQIFGSITNMVKARSACLFEMKELQGYLYSSFQFGAFTGPNFGRIRRSDSL